MKSIYEKWKVTIVVSLVISFLVASPALAKWSDQSVLPSMSSLNIFELTRSLVSETDGMIKNTEQLQTEVSQASMTLDALKQQNQLLTSQVDTNQGIQKELNTQLAGNIKARELMKQILTREEKTLQFTKQVADQANLITGQMGSTVQSLNEVAKETGSVGTNTQQLNQQVDLLLVQLDQSVKNFRFIARITDAVRYLEQKTGIHLPIPNPSSSDSTKNPVPLPSLEKPVDDLLDTILPNKKQNDQGEDSGLLDILLP